MHKKLKFPHLWRYGYYEVVVDVESLQALELPQGGRERLRGVGSSWKRLPADGQSS